MTIADKFIRDYGLEIDFDPATSVGSVTQEGRVIISFFRADDWEKAKRKVVTILKNYMSRPQYRRDHV